MEDHSLEEMLEDRFGFNKAHVGFDSVCSATLSREIVEFIRQRETAYRMLEAMETNVKMKRLVVQELEMEQMAARSSVSVRDSITAGCRMAAESSIGKRDSKNIEQLRKHVAQIMGGNEVLHEAMELWEDPKGNGGDHAHRSDGILRGRR